MSDQDRVLEQHPFTDAIDIYIFSNGQEYSPPRKYHLGAEDLDLWKSTLGFLARTQFGALHSNIDLFTVDGKKVVGPLGLRHGAYYVAVEPPDKFMKAGYEKYLIRASRSQEKRQSRRFDSITESDPHNLDSDHKKDDCLLHTIVSSTVNRHSSVLVKPEPPKTIQKKQQISSLKVEKNWNLCSRPSITKKNNPKSSITNPSIRSLIKHRDSIQVRRGIQGEANAKIAISETDKIPVSSSAIPLIKVPAKTKFNKTTRQKESLPRVLSKLDKVSEEHHELNKICSGIKILNHNKQDRNIFVLNMDIENVIDDKDIDKGCTLNNCNGISLADSGMKNGSTKNIIETVLDNAVQGVHKISDGYHDVNNNANTFEASNENDTKNRSNNLAEERHDILNVSNKLKGSSSTCTKSDVVTYSQEQIKIIKINDSPGLESNKHSVFIATDNIADNRREVIYISPHEAMESMIFNNEITVNRTHSNAESNKHLVFITTDNISDNRQEVINVSPQEAKDSLTVNNEITVNRTQSNAESNKHLVFITTDIPDNQQDVENISPQEAKENMTVNNDMTLNITQSNVESNKHLVFITTDNMPDNRQDVINISPQKAEESMTVNNDITLNRTQSNDNVQLSNVTPASPDKNADKYIGVIQKGDVVNLNFNIEIKNCGSCNDKHKDSAVNLHSATDIVYTEKGSQINVTSHILLQNKSLVSLITNEIKGCNDEADKHPVIIVQCGNCKYCKKQNGTSPNKKPNQNYLFVLPADKYEEKFNRCNCEKSLIHSCNSSYYNPVKQVFSCASLQRITKLRKDENAVFEAAETVTHEHEENTYHESKGSEMGLKRKVAICDECLSETRVSSKVFHEITVTPDGFSCEDHNECKETHSNIQVTQVDNYTQTDWCDVLLEARLLEDGHYSFRLPTLETLKLYYLG